MLGPAPLASVTAMTPLSLRTPTCILAVVAAGVGLGACRVTPAPARAGETAGIVRVVGEAISYPRQTTANGFARAALATTAARDGRLTVLEAVDLHPSVRTVEDRLRPMARLVFRVHVDAVSDGWHDWPAATHCYTTDFNEYGLVGKPGRTTWPPSLPRRVARCHPWSRSASKVATFGSP